MNKREAFTLREGDIVSKRGLECRVISMVPIATYGAITTRITLKRVDGKPFADTFGGTNLTIETDHKGWKLVRKADS